MTRSTSYPPANRTVQWWASKFTGSTMNPNVVCLHSTEGTGWPAYSGGATAPHLTARPDFKNKRIDWRQHFRLDKSSRALVNKLGGVETNTLNVVQIELVGTCDPTTKTKWEKLGLEAGRDFVYMPDAPDWFISDLADFVRWMHAEWAGFPIRSAAVRGFGAYPGSYGASRYRLSYSEWMNAYGILGHQHVPENSHGDPGSFPIDKLLAAAKGTQVPAPTPEPPPAAPQTAVWDLPSTWALGATGDAVTRLGERLRVHAAADGRPDPYKVGPGPVFTTTDQAGVKAFQEAQGWSGADADGFPGPVTFARLAAAPPVKDSPVPVDAMFTALAGYNGLTAKGVTQWKKNTDGLAEIVLSQAPDLLGTTELSNRAINKMKPRLVAALAKLLILVNGGSDGRYIFRNPKTTRWVAHKLVTTPNTSKLRLRKDDKQGFILVYDKGEARGVYGVFHAENEAGFDQGRVDQAMWFAGQVESLAAVHDVPDENVLIALDGNSMAWVANAFRTRGYNVLGAASFVGWDRKSDKPFDLAVTPGKGDARVVSSDGNSDHDWLHITHYLTKNPNA